VHGRRETRSALRLLDSRCLRVAARATLKQTARAAAVAVKTQRPLGAGSARRCARRMELSRLQHGRCEEGFTWVSSRLHPWPALSQMLTSQSSAAAGPLHHQTTDRDMSLVAGPGRGGIANMPGEMQLFVEKHVRYIQSLDTVRTW
jgi:hypothetical protein